MDNFEESYIYFMRINTYMQHKILKKVTLQDVHRFRLACRYSRDLSELNARRKFPITASKVVADEGGYEEFRCRFLHEFGDNNLKVIPSTPIPNLLAITSPKMIVQEILSEEMCRGILKVVRMNPVRSYRLVFDQAVLCGPDLFQELIGEIKCRNIYFREIQLGFMDEGLFDVDVVQNMPKLIVAESISMIDRQFLAMRCRHMEFARCPALSSVGVTRFIQEWKENRREITFCKITLSRDMEGDDDWFARLGFGGGGRDWHLTKGNGGRLYVRITLLKNDISQYRIFTKEIQEELADDPNDLLPGGDNDLFGAAYDYDTDHDSDECEDDNCHICIERKYPESGDESTDEDESSDEEVEESDGDEEFE